MRDVQTRTDQALLMAAGIPVHQESICDFRLDRTSNHDWRITALSLRAREWVHQELCGPLCQCLNDSIVVDVLSADRFLKQIHDQGFRTEFVGIGGMDSF